MMNNLKINLKSIISIITGVILIISSAFAVDEIYVRKISFEEKIEHIRVKQLEDKIFELDFKVKSGQAVPLDRALLERYLRELEAIRAKDHKNEN